MDLQKLIEQPDEYLHVSKRLVGKPLLLPSPSPSFFRFFRKQTVLLLRKLLMEDECSEQIVSLYLLLTSEFKKPSLDGEERYEKSVLQKMYSAIFCLEAIVPHLIRCTLEEFVEIVLQSPSKVRGAG
jgi:hypothetical protein